MNNNLWVIFGVITIYFGIILWMLRGFLNDLSSINKALLHILDVQKYNLELHVQSGYVFVEHDKRLKVLEKVDLSNCKFEGE